MFAKLKHTMGSTKLWLPSRKSVASHLGGLVMVLEGHCLLSSLRGGNGLYFFEGSLSLCRTASALESERQNGLGGSHRHFDRNAGSNCSIESAFFADNPLLMVATNEATSYTTET